MVDDTGAVLALHAQLARVMGDARFGDGREMGPELRQFLLGWCWAQFEEPVDRMAAWKRCLTLAGLSGRRSSRESASYWRWMGLLRADAPRYQPPDWYGFRQCEAVMLRGPRAGEVCGRSAGLTFRVTDPATGVWRMSGWCSDKRHRAEGAALERVQRAYRQLPVPPPNVGGLLPCYIPASNWPDLYAAAASYGWKPPAVGIVADDWPVMEKVLAAARPRLVALDGDCEGGAGELPALRLVGPGG